MSQRHILLIDDEDDIRKGPFDPLTLSDQITAVLTGSDRTP